MGMTIKELEAKLAVTKSAKERFEIEQGISS